MANRLLLQALKDAQDLRAHLYGTAFRLALRASRRDRVTMSHAEIARMMHYKPRTSKRHMKALEERQVVHTDPVWVGRHRCAKNTYQFIIPQRPSPAHPYSGDITRRGASSLAKMSSRSFLKIQEGEKKDLRREWEEQLRKQERAIHLEYVTPGSDAYARCQEEIARLRALLEASSGR